MGLIKRVRIEDKGEITLQERPIEMSGFDTGLMYHPEPELETQIDNFEEPPQPIQQISVSGMELSDAEKKAREIIQSAQSQAESIKSKAYEKGLADSRHNAEDKMREALDTINQAVKERKAIIKDAEGEILRIALKSAEQIIRSEVSLHRDVCLNIVSDAINRVSDREQVIVRVNREDAEYIKKFKDKLSGIVDGIKSFSILEDSQIEPGGCIIETNLGYVDARISTKLHAIEDALKHVAEGKN